MTGELDIRAEPDEKHWVVVGGGLAGLTIARDLAAAGRIVTVLEAAPSIGGLAGTWSIGDVHWDKHYHVILDGDTRTLAMLDRLGLADDVVWKKTLTGCFADGKLHSASGPVEFLKLPFLSLIDKVRLGVTVLGAARITDGAPLEKITAEAWLTKWSGRRAYNRFWAPLLRAKLGDDYSLASASFIWAIIRRLYGARDTTGNDEKLGYVRGGYARVFERFADYLGERGVDLRTGAAVAAVRSAPNGVEIELASGEVIAADHAVITAAAPVAARLIPELTQEESDRLRSIRHLGVLCASALIRRPLSGYYVTNLVDTSLPITGVVEMTALVDPSEMGGHHLVYLPRYTTPNDEARDWTDEKIREEFLGALHRVEPSFDPTDVIEFKVSRVTHVLPLPTLDYSKVVPPMETSVDGISIVTSAQIINGTLNVDETVRLAERSATALLLTERYDHGSTGHQSFPRS